MAKKKKVAKRAAKPAKKAAKAAPARAKKTAAKAPAAKAAKAAPVAKAAPAPSAGIAKSFVLAEMKFAHDILTKLLADFPEDKAQFQPSASDTHLIWHLGHLATNYAWFRSSFDGQKIELPETFNALFGMGSKANADAGAYPTLAEVRAVFERAWAATLAAFEAQSEEQLVGPPAVDTGGFAKTKMEIGMHTAWHDGWHSGQLSSVRRALALKPIWG